MNILITLCARGGSKGIPGKNIRLLNHIPLIVYSINAAKKFATIVDDRVDIILSTDADEIKKIVKPFGLETEYTRPDFLANDTAGKLDAIIHVKEYAEQTHGINYDILIDLDVSSPLRTADDLLEAFDIIKNSDALNLFSVNIANRNPYFNMVELAENGYYNVCKSPEKTILSRQKSPKVYDLNASFYFYTKEFFDKKIKSVICEKSLIYEMPHICFDLDHEIDFDFMEYLLCNNKLPFSI